MEIEDPELTKREGMYIRIEYPNPHPNSFIPSKQLMDEVRNSIKDYPIEKIIGNCHGIFIKL